MSITTTTSGMYSIPVVVPLSINNQNITLTGSANIDYVTPDSVSKYLVEMEWYRMGHRWGHKEIPNAYMTWEQAVVYCLVRPFFNP